VTTASGPAYGPKCGRLTPILGTFISISNRRVVSCRPGW
jgi:hypothetical protein